MQIRQLKANNFRGISHLDWKPGQNFCCLIGPGDTGKSTILDAIEAALSPRWVFFTEPDFLNCSTVNSILIEVTVGELSKSLKSDERFGLYIRGWTTAGDLRDEPEDDDEPVLTVRITVDATMEPVWELVCDRVEAPRTLSNRDRALFGLVRLVGEDARHLTWGQGSVLSRLTGDTDEAAAHLAEAYRTARASANLNQIEALSNTAKLAETFAKNLGAYVNNVYIPDLELGRSGLSSGSIALHDGSVPLRLAGLGTRRLATLAIQKSAINEGAIILIDEIEHGLEPHRIIGAIAHLKADQTEASSKGQPTGQVFITTHSDVALAEAGGDSLWVVQTKRHESSDTVILKPSCPNSIRILMRFTPRALFARRVLIMEGNTEIGLLLGIRENWPLLHGGKPIEQLGSAIADGNGAQAYSMALALNKLGYVTAIYRDSDKALSVENITELKTGGIAVFEYGSNLNTEQAIFSAASDNMVQDLLNYARREKGDNSVDTCLNNKLDTLPISVIRGNFSGWGNTCGLNGLQLREAIADVASKNKWFKDQHRARGLASMVWAIICDKPDSPIAMTLKQAEDWLYA